MPGRDSPLNLAATCSAATDHCQCSPETASFPYRLCALQTRGGRLGACGSASWGSDGVLSGSQDRCCYFEAAASRHRSFGQDNTRGDWTGGKVGHSGSPPLRYYTEACETRRAWLLDNRENQQKLMIMAVWVCLV